MIAVTTKHTTLSTAISQIIIADWPSQTYQADLEIFLHIPISAFNIIVVSMMSHSLFQPSIIIKCTTLIPKIVHVLSTVPLLKKFCYSLLKYYYIIGTPRLNLSF